MRSVGRQNSVSKKLIEMPLEQNMLAVVSSNQRPGQNGSKTPLRGGKVWVPVLNCITDFDVSVENNI